VKDYDIGQTVSSSKPQDIAAAINTIFADREALSRMSCNALKAAQSEFCWEQELSKLIHFYQDIQQSASKMRHVSVGKKQASARASIGNRRRA